MARSRLTPNEIDSIVGLLTSWSGELTWGLLVDRVTALLRRPFTRQGLDKHESIRIAFKLAKKRVRKDEGKQRRNLRQGASALDVAQHTIDNLREEILVLKAEKQRFLERFAVWTYNARSRGISEQDLNQQLPTIDRRPSESKS